MTENDVQPAGPACPWCSAALPSADVSTCPSCGATLIGESDTALPGSRPSIPRRSSGAPGPPRPGDEGDDEEAPATPGSLAPPPPEVQREMLRMELEAEVLDLQAEAEALAAAAREEGLSEDEQALQAVADDAAAVAGAGDADRLSPAGDPAAAVTSPVSTASGAAAPSAERPPRDLGPTA